MGITFVELLATVRQIILRFGKIVLADVAQKGSVRGEAIRVHWSSCIMTLCASQHKEEIIGVRTGTLAIPEAATDLHSPTRSIRLAEALFGSIIGVTITGGGFSFFRMNA